jgi:hypothetical protein
MKTLQQLLDFQNLQIILSHFDSFFGNFMGVEWLSKALFANLLPLSPNENGVQTFLQ